MFFKDYIWLIWDIAAALIIICCIHTCARHGFLRNIISFFSYILAAVAAKAFGPPVAGLLYDYIIRDAIVVFADKELGSAVESGRDFTVSLVESFPAFLRPYLPLADELANTGSLAAMDTRDIISGIVDSAVQAPVLTLTSSVCYMLIFSIVLYLARHASRIFSGVNMIPVIGPLNTLLGGLTGLIQAVIMLLLLSAAFTLVILLSGDKLEWVNNRIIDGTYIWRVFFCVVAA